MFVEMLEERRIVELVGTPGAYRLRLRVIRSESRTGGRKNVRKCDLGELEWTCELKKQHALDER